MKKKRDSYPEYERQALELCGHNEYVAQNRRKRVSNVRLNGLDGPHTPQIELTPSEAFQVHSFLPFIDQFIVSLIKRISAYSEIYNLLGFLKELHALSPSEITQHAKELCDVYKDDLDENLCIELQHYKEFCCEFIHEKEKGMSFELFMHKLLIRKNVKASFPNVEILLRIYFWIILNCSGKRAFSKLKLIKDRLSASMSEDGLIDRTILNTEYDILRDLNITDIINDLADKKARKKDF